MLATAFAAKVEHVVARCEIEGEDEMESGKCKHCGGPIVRGTANESWKHWGTFKELCLPAPVAEPIRNDSGEVKPLLTK